MQIDHLLRASRATDAFQRDVRAYVHAGRAERIVLRRAAPPIKVLRVIAQLLEQHPDLVIDAVRIDARSGCADFTGTLEVETADGSRAYAFTWDCAWRAREEGWTDCFGFPDQIRAATELEWRCFREWRALFPAVSVTGESERRCVGSSVRRCVGASVTARTASRVAQRSVSPGRIGTPAPPPTH